MRSYRFSSLLIEHWHTDRDRPPLTQLDTNWRFTFDGYLERGSSGVVAVSVVVVSVAVEMSVLISDVSMVKVLLVDGPDVDCVVVFEACVESLLLSSPPDRRSTATTAMAITATTRPAISAILPLPPPPPGRWP